MFYGQARLKLGKREKLQFRGCTVYYRRPIYLRKTAVCVLKFSCSSAAGRSRAYINRHFGANVDYFMVVAQHGFKKVRLTFV